MDAEEALPIGSLMQVLFGEFDAIEAQRNQAANKVVVVTAQVDDARAILFRHLENATDDGGVRRAPVILALQRPEIDDVTVKDEFIATDTA